MAIDLQKIMNNHKALGLNARNFGSQLNAHSTLLTDLHEAADQFQDEFISSLAPGAKVNPNLTISLWARICAGIGLAKDRLAALIQTEKDNRKLMLMTHELALAAK